MGKFDSKCGIGTLLGYFETSKAYKVYNPKTLFIEEAIHVRFNDTKPNTKMSKLDESFANVRLVEDIGPLIEPSKGTDTSNQVIGKPQEEREPNGQILRKNHPKS